MSQSHFCTKDCYLNQYTIVLVHSVSKWDTFKTDQHDSQCCEDEFPKWLQNVPFNLFNLLWRKAVQTQNGPMWKIIIS